MWALLPRKFQLVIVLAAGFLIAYGLEAGWALFTGQESGLLKWVSLVATLVGVVLTALAQLLWFKLLNWWPWLQTKTFPDLNGTWKGMLISTWQDPTTGQSPAPIPTTVVIRQTVFSTHVSLQTGESKSESRDRASAGGSTSTVPVGYRRSRKIHVTRSLSRRMVSARQPVRIEIPVQVENETLMPAAARA